MRGGTLVTVRREHEGRGFRFGRRFEGRSANAAPDGKTPLERYFDEHTSGPGIWKFRHYFDIYHRHFERFRGHDVHVLEIGVYSGGSLRMWREYFGPAATIYGVDIDPACRSYEDDRIKIFIGDQGDPAFWAELLNDLSAIDIVIDDGSHRPEDQITSLECLLPALRPGGVYLCEDIKQRTNAFHDYIAGLSCNLNEVGPAPTSFQRSVESIHLYPWVVVIEKRATALEKLVAPKHGTEWLPWP
jgi:hypothetical protein